MNWKRYMKNLMPAMLINLAGMVALALFLLASGSSIDTVVFIVVIWLLVFVIYMVVSCYGRKRYLDKLLDITDQLEEAYLIADLMKEPERADDEVFYQILKLAEKSMLENISAVMQERRDYRDYIEQWVHEVKTPITAMKLLCENHPSEFSRAILTELEKVDRFTEQTLYYARSEHTQKDYAIREIQLSDVVHGAIADNKYLLRQNDVSIEMEMVTDTVYTDDKWVRFILNQLIGNSIKYRTEKPRLTFYTEQQSNQVLLFIKDNGIGIAEADLPRVFEKGFTGQNGRNIQNSTGIGLYLCKRLCDKLGIGLSLHSGNNGTTAILLLLFLIRYVNSYMLRRKQKEFAVQSIMGMEQKTIGWLFFAETFLMGAISIAIGIALGVLCSQFMSAMLLASYGHSYELTWTLFPDTVLWTVGFFTISFFVVGLFNVRTIRKIKIIDMLSADRQNEPDLKKNRFIPAILVIYLVLSIWMLETGIQKMIFFFDPRFAFPLHILFWGNIIFPAFTLLWSFVWLLKKKVWTLQTLLIGLLACTVPNTVLAALVPVFESKYYLTLGAGTINQYLLFVVVDLLFLICGIIYLSSSAIVAWKSKSPAHRYQGNNLFFFGQIISKLTTTTKTMTLICITLTMAILMFIIAPVLTEWSMGYLDSRSMYDVQINSRYYEHDSSYYRYRS